MQNKENTDTIQITMGDLNAKTPELRDNNSNPTGPHLAKHLKQKKWTTLKKEFAYGTNIRSKRRRKKHSGRSASTE